ncbi:MAG: vWA domain-containing protein [Candidatus Parabeggiatoa sp.]|nr:vWA domain-containing protein [Candidatus Parabeggiatoa sp.]
MPAYEGDKYGFAQPKKRRSVKPTKKGILSPKTEEILEKGKDRETEIPEIPDFVDPVFACFVIDASPSMSPYRMDVIQSHPVMLDVLRESAKCKNDALYVIQYLFSGTSKQLHPFEKLDVQKKDAVVLLNQKNYDTNQGSGTALYDTVFELLQEMNATIEVCYDDGIPSTFSIGVITDGDDNVSKVKPADIRSVVEDLREKGYLRSSVILGLLDKQFSEKRLQEIKKMLAFDKAIPLGKEPAEIRRAFELASQSSLG